MKTLCEGYRFYTGS